MKRRKKFKKNNLDIYAIIIFFIIIFGIIVYLYNPDLETISKENIKNNQEKINRNQECPEELDLDYIKIVQFDNTIKFPEGIYLIDSDYVNGIGYFSGNCIKGKYDGENINYIYCDNDGKGIFYKRNEAIDKDGVINKDFPEWKIKIILDSRTCNKYQDEKKINGIKYECKILEIECKKSWL